MTMIFIINLLIQKYFQNQSKMQSVISTIVGVIAGTPYSSIITSIVALPFRGSIDYKYFFGAQAITQSCWLIYYYYKKRKNYQRDLDNYNKSLIRNSGPNDLAGAFVFLIFMLPWMFLETLFGSKKPKIPIYSTFLRGIGKALLFVASYEIFYWADHISIEFK